MNPDLPIEDTDDRDMIIFKTKRHFRAILLMVKQQMMDKEEYERLNLKYHKSKAKLKIIDEVLDEGLDLAAERRRLADKERSALSKRNNTKIKKINWTTLGCPYMEGRDIPK